MSQIQIEPDAPQDDAERALWCMAWRLLQRHGAGVDGIIEGELRGALRRADPARADYWRQVAQAVEELRK